MLVLVQFIALAAGKPAEYGRFAILPDTFLAIEAAAAAWTILKLQWHRRLAAAALSATTAVFGFMYLLHFIADCGGATTRLRAAKELASLPLTEAIAVENEPHLLIAPGEPVHPADRAAAQGPGRADAIEEPAVRFRPVDEPAPFQFDGDTQPLPHDADRQRFPLPARISWAGKTFELKWIGRPPGRGTRGIVRRPLPIRAAMFAKQMIFSDLSPRRCRMNETHDRSSRYILDSPWTAACRGKWSVVTEPELNPGQTAPPAAHAAGDGATGPNEASLCLSALLEAQSELSAAELEPDSLVRLVADRASALCGADGAAAALIDRDEYVYRYASGILSLYTGVRFGTDAGVLSYSLRTGEAYHCRDSETDPGTEDYVWCHLGARSMVVVPLRHAGQMIGLLQVVSSRPHAFRTWHVQTLRVLGGVLAAAVNHVAAQGSNRKLLTGASPRPPPCARARERFRNAFDIASAGMAIVALDGRWLRQPGAVRDARLWREGIALDRLPEHHPPRRPGGRPGQRQAPGHRRHAVLSPGQALSSTSTGTSCGCC